MAAAPQAILYRFFFNTCRSFLSAPKSAHVNEGSQSVSYHSIFLVLDMV